MAGVPVVSTRTGCIPELEEQYNQPLVFPLPDDPQPDEIVNGIVKCVYPQEREPLVRVAKGVAYENFTASQMARAWGYYLQGVCSAERGNCIIQG